MKYDNWINAKYKELETVSLNIKKNDPGHRRHSKMFVLAAIAVHAFVLHAGTVVQDDNASQSKSGKFDPRSLNC